MTVWIFKKDYCKYCNNIPLNIKKRMTKFIKTIEAKEIRGSDEYYIISKLIFLKSERSENTKKPAPSDSRIQWYKFNLYVFFLKGIINGLCKLNTIFSIFKNILFQLDVRIVATYKNRHVCQVTNPSKTYSLVHCKCKLK